MSTFNRDFNVSKATDGLDRNPWFADLLRLWQPPGNHVSAEPDTDDDAPLRLAVRNGYLNLYQRGQSVARISFDRSKRLRAEIHEKYIHGREATGQTYVSLTADGYLDRLGKLQTYQGPKAIEEWIHNARKRAGPEKTFVEAVVARNTNVIDLEMALPAYLTEASERRAPRMDLVALEPIGSSFKIVFWEAKLVGDARARRGGEEAPEVCRQLKSYTDWLAYKGHSELVAAAYVNTCKILVAMHKEANALNREIGPLGEAIEAVASGAPLIVDDKPRILIYEPEADPSFEKHLRKLRLDHHIQVVKEGANMRLETL